MTTHAIQQGINSIDPARYRSGYSEGLKGQLIKEPMATISWLAGYVMGLHDAGVKHPDFESVAQRVQADQFLQSKLESAT